VIQTMLHVRYVAFLTLLLFMGAGMARAENPATLLTVGAIRWDGWYKGNSWQKNLAAPQWHYRLPFYASTDAQGNLEICGDSQEVMDREIAFAKAGGISYWAFCYYHPKSWEQADAYNYGWRRFLAAADKKGLRFCFILQGGKHLGPANEWGTTLSQFTDLFQNSAYQRVCGNRPLLFVFTGEKLISHFGSAEAAASAFKALREASKKNCGGDPYIVAQIWPHQIQADFLKAIQFDALSAYSAPGDKGENEPYAKLQEMNRWYWEQFKAAGCEVVPLVNAGWDGRPRNYTGAWYQHATPKEAANAINEGLDWVLQNSAIAPAKTVLVYAWNEHDEGGWLCPTLDEGPARLDAIKAMQDTFHK